MTGQSGEKCTITSAAAVAETFGAKISSDMVGTTGTGRAMCVFVLSASNVGLPGRVVTVMDTSSNVAQLTQAQNAQTSAVPLTGVGDRAFYSPSLTTIQLMKGKTLVIVQATLRVPAGPQAKPDVVQADLTALGRSIASQI